MNVSQSNSVIAGLAPLVLSLALGGPYINCRKKRYRGQYIREDGPQSHHSKAGTPTAGGVLILAAFVAGLLGVCILHGFSFLTLPVLMVVCVTLVFGALGFVDDYLKISKKKNKG